MNDDIINRQDAIEALDEIIKHFDDMAEECRRNANIERNDYMDMRDDAAEYRQLSIWLNELKWLRERFQSQPEYYDYSDIEPLWKSFAEENDINLTDTAKQLKDAMWCGYRKGKADAQSEPYKEKLNEIASALSEKFAYMNTCLNERDIILGYLGVKRSCEIHCYTDCINTKCESHPSSAQPEDKCSECDAWNKYKNYPQERRWIPVSERLPEDSSPVLITHRGGVSYGWYNGRYFERGANTNHRKLQTVIAWMPLPKPYQGEGE